MAQMIRPMVAGNWKMNGSRASLDELALMSTGFTPALRQKLDLMICPPATLVLAAQRLALQCRSRQEALRESAPSRS